MIPLVESYMLDGKEIEYVPPNQIRGYRVQPTIKNYPAFSEDVSSLTESSKMPEALTNILKTIEEKTGCKITGIGVGPQRDQFIKLK